MNGFGTSIALFLAMKVAISTWNGRISPVFDTARRLLLVDVEQGREIGRRDEAIEETEPQRSAARIANLAIDVLICCAISRPLEAMLLSAGIEVIPRTCGDVEEVLAAFVSGRLTERTFLMPGCCNRGRHGRRRGTCRSRRVQAGLNGEGRQPMKVAVTSQGDDMTSEVDPRFGRAGFFIVIDTETGAWTPYENSQNLDTFQGAGIQAARKVTELGVEAVVTGNVGPKAYLVLEAGGVAVYIGADGTVQNAIEQLKAGQLGCTRAANVEGHWM